ncbi:hypothetical protein [Streptomyces axinellae]|uniref:Uncharacterized protein n=1 Tax=Streptomyces axinellae TaxID=552788 RepID=A0ABN3Q5F9_9ACTN
MSPEPDAEVVVAFRDERIELEPIAETSRPGTPTFEAATTSAAALASAAAPGRGGTSESEVPAPVTVTFRDESTREEVRAVPDGRGGWSVDFARAGSWAQANRSQITSGVKSLAIALVASGALAKALGHMGQGKMVQTVGNVLNATAAGSDVWHYGKSARESHEQELSMMARLKDFGKTVGQVVNIAAGITAAATDNLIAQAAAHFTIFAALMATGESVQEKQKRERDEMHLFYRQRDAHLEEGRIVSGHAMDLGSGAETLGTTTPQHGLSRSNTVHFVPPRFVRTATGATAATTRSVGQASHSSGMSGNLEVPYGSRAYLPSAGQGPGQGRGQGGGRRSPGV